MSRLKNLILALIISPEIALTLAFFLFSSIWPNYAAILGGAIRADTEVWKYLPALTLVFSGAAINSSFKLRAPLENFSNKSLYQWPAYQLLVDRVYVGLFYGILASVAGIMLWILGGKLNNIHVAEIFLVATLTSGTTALSMLLAQQKLREIMEKNL